MPTMANITAKNAANTDVTFEVVTPSGGDGSPAIWQLTAAGDAESFRPRATMIARRSANRASRKVLASLTVPYVVTDTNTGLNRVVSVIDIRNGEMTVPSNVPDSVVANAVAYWSSLMGSTLWKSCFTARYAAV